MEPTSSCHLFWMISRCLSHDASNIVRVAAKSYRLIRKTADPHIFCINIAVDKITDAYCSSKAGYRQRPRKESRRRSRSRSRSASPREAMNPAAASHYTEEPPPPPPRHAPSHSKSRSMSRSRSRSRSWAGRKSGGR